MSDTQHQTRNTGPVLEMHYRFILWLIPTVSRMPRNQKFLLGDRIQKTALDVLESLIEATYTHRRKNHLSDANMGLEKLRFLFRLTRDMHYLDLRRYEYAARSLDAIGRKLGAWKKIHHAKEKAELV